MTEERQRDDASEATLEGRRLDGGDTAVDKRRRLFAAMATSCRERGYEATTVADLLALAGVSRAGFYAEFANKEACFEAMLTGAFAQGMAIVEGKVAAGEPGVEAVEAALATLARLVAHEPTLARACMIDSFAAGSGVREIVDAASEQLRNALVGAVGGKFAHPAMPTELALGATGAVYKIFRDRVLSDRAAELPKLAPALALWLARQEPPPSPLRAPRRGSGLSPFSPAFALRDPAERILRATAACIAERGYVATTVAEIAARGRLSQRTFYEHFAGKEEATVAALDSSGAQMLAATMPALRRAADWPTGVHSAYTALCGFMAAEPDLARLRVIEVYAAGPKALEVRDWAGTELLEKLLETAPPEVTAVAEPLLLEAITAGVYAMVYDQVKAHGPEGLPAIVPHATYLALAPLIGPEAACEAANGGGRRR